MIKFLQLGFQGVALGSIYALIALGFVIVFKGTGVFNFAQGDFVMASAYIVVVASATMPYGVAVLIALLSMAAVALASERFLMRPMIGKPFFSVVLVTLGLAIMVRAVLAMAFGVRERGSSEGPIGRGVVRVGDVALSWVGMWTIIVAGGLMTAVWLFFQRTRYGLGLRATASSQEAALAQGIDIRRMFALSWVIAGVLAVAAGIFLGAFPRQVEPSMGEVALITLPALIIGGFDSLIGAVLGGLTVGLLQVLGSGYLSDFAGGQLPQVLPYAAMIVVLVVRPYGLFGSRDVERL